MLKPWGVMKGSELLDDSVTCLESFGAGVYPLGKVNGVPWWITTLRRCEDRFRRSRRPQRLLLYKGIMGGMPPVSSGERIGDLPDSQSQEFLTFGDWDADDYPDLAVVVQKFDDTSDGNNGYQREYLCIYWGSPKGYSALDTTRLPVGGYSLPIVIYGGVSHDFTGDSISDLAVSGGIGMRNGVLVPTAQFHVFAGHRGKRWGRDGVDRRASFEWWNPPALKSFNTLQMIDQDCDGRKDLVFVRGDVPGTTVAIIYGTDTPGIDTTAVDSIFYPPARLAIFSDLTGDGVPEMCMNCGGEELRIYAGRPGQRIREQLGTGNDPPDLGNGRPYARPWAITWLPYRINFTWSQASWSPLYSFDVNGDGLNDLATISDPFFIVYTSRLLFSDSLIDAEIDMRSAGGVMTVVPMGDIDGSGVPTVGIGVSKGSGSLWLMKPNPDVAVAGDYHEPPHKEGFRCEHAAGVRSLPTTAPTQTLQLSVQPNPSSTEVSVTWKNTKGGTAMIIISDMIGKVLQRIVVAQGSQGYVWHTSGWQAGEYLLTVQCSGQTGSALVRVR